MSEQDNNRKKSEFSYGLGLGVLCHFANALFYLILYSFYSLFSTNISLISNLTIFSIILIFSFFIYWMIKKRKWEILKGFLIGFILMPFILAGICFGLIFIIFFLVAK